MRTKRDVEVRLKATLDTIKKLEVEFKKYDNHEDMELIASYEVVARTLRWVLEK